VAAGVAPAINLQAVATRAGLRATSVSPVQRPEFLSENDRRKHQKHGMEEKSFQCFTICLRSNRGGAKTWYQNIGYKNELAG
jgi:hypothetical protein